MPAGRAHEVNDRVEELKKSGDWDKYSLGLIDNDSFDFQKRAGMSDPLGMVEITLFTRGIKSLGLWDDMVCWPMRARQNAGTGSTVYSLGGLGIYNGTLQNGPEWDPFGVNYHSGSVRCRVNEWSNSFKSSIYFIVKRNPELLGGGIIGLPNGYAGIQPLVTNGGNANTISPAISNLSTTGIASAAENVTPFDFYSGFYYANTAEGFFVFSINKNVFKRRDFVPTSFTNPYALSIGNGNTVNWPFRSIISVVVTFQTEISFEQRNDLDDFTKKVLVREKF